MAKMGLSFGLESGKYCKRQFRWIFTIPDVVADSTSNQRGINALPPEKASRPSISFKEMDAKHLSEDVFFPVKPEWKPVTITVWDLNNNIKHPVFEWIKYFYNPETGYIFAPNTKDKLDQSLFRTCRLEMLDGCGEINETWTFEDAWPQAVNFQTLDMTSSGIVMCEITLRYSRAYIN